MTVTTAADLDEQAERLTGLALSGNDVTQAVTRIAHPTHTPEQAIACWDEVTTWIRNRDALSDGSAHPDEVFGEGFDGDPAEEATRRAEDAKRHLLTGVPA